MAFMQRLLLQTAKRGSSIRFSLHNGRSLLRLLILLLTLILFLGLSNDIILLFVISCPADGRWCFHHLGLYTAIALLLQILILFEKL